MLNNLKKKIESLMYSDKKSDESLSDRCFSGLSLCYGKAMHIRESLYSKKKKKRYELPCYVVSVGNITVGGTGKTPMVIYLAGLIKKSGFKPAVVSRGYGGDKSSTGGVVSTGEKILLNAKMAGDEPFMMAKRLLPLSVPVVIGSNRYNAGMQAVESFKPDVIILDDGFQHLKLKRDLDILLFDAKSPIGNGNIIPRGIMREPALAMKRADIFVLTRVENMQGASPVDSFYKSVSGFVLRDDLNDIPLFTSTHKAHIYGRIKPCSKNHELCLRSSQTKTLINNKDNLSFTDCHSLTIDKDVFAFSGIAKNHEFRKTAESMGYNINDYFEFPDHYLYTKSDCEKIAEAAGNSCVKTIITSEKDYVKIAGLAVWDFELIIIGVEIDFGNYEKSFNDLLKSKILKKNGGL